MVIYISILNGIIFSLLLVILKMRSEHVQQLEYYINRYWDMEEELFQYKRNELEKENDNDTEIQDSL